MRRPRARSSLIVSAMAADSLYDVLGVARDGSLLRKGNRITPEQLKDAIVDAATAQGLQQSDIITMYQASTVAGTLKRWRTWQGIEDDDAETPEEECCNLWLHFWA